MKIKILPIISILAGILALSSCTYNEGIDSTTVKVKLSEPIGVAEVTFTSTLGNSYTTEVEESGSGVIVLSPGIYSAAVSKTSDDGYNRTVFNGSVSDIVVSGPNVEITIPIVKATVNLSNPILIKEIYVGGCQKDDGSGRFSYDKSVILYNNSSEPASLDNVAIGMVEPYNAEANLHNFLKSGVLDYENEDWIPAINGIWYFQEGNFIGPYSELVVNIHGAIDNTLTYSNSVNYANPDYFCMYDVEATSSDGGKYNNTSYYPSPSEVIPTGHYLKAVKYGQANAWPISQTSPALVLFRPEDISITDFAQDISNIIYPSDKQGDIIWACLKLPRAWVLDAVEVYNAEKLPDSKKRLTSDLDNGYVMITSGYSHSAVRKVENYVNGHEIYLDTNNSSNDFYEAERFSLL